MPGRYAPAWVRAGAFVGFVVGATVLTLGLGGLIVGREMVRAALGLRPWP